MLGDRYKITDSKGNPVKVVSAKTQQADAAKVEKEMPFSGTFKLRFKPFTAIGKAVRFIRYPFGHEQHANPYIQEAVQNVASTSANLTAYVVPVVLGVIDVFKATGNFVTTYVPGAKIVGHTSYPFLRAAIWTGRKISRNGGAWLAKGAFHYTCCEHAPKNQNGTPREWFFSPLQVANSAAFGALVWGASVVVPPAANLVAGILTPVYLEATTHTWHQVEINGKTAENSEGVFNIYVTTLEDRARAKTRRAAGEKIEDDEIARRFDIEDSLYLGITNPGQIAGAIPISGKCDEVTTAGIWLRTPRIKWGGHTFLKPWVIVAPLVEGTVGCAAYGSGEQHSNIKTPTRYRLANGTNSLTFISKETLALD